MLRNSMAKATPNDIFQYSLYSAYHAGLKEGGPPVGFLSNQGNHGIGLFDDEESEMIQVDGVTYILDRDGDAEKADKEEQLPFVMATMFQPMQRAKPPSSTTNTMLKEVFAKGKNTTMPFRIKGPFKYINTRQQTFWDVRGVIFGFYVPTWQSAISGEGLQCCFLSENKKQGGHVIDFETGDGAVVEWAKCGRLHLAYPQHDEFEELEL